MKNIFQIPPRRQEKGKSPAQQDARKSPPRLVVNPEQSQTIPNVAAIRRGREDHAL